MTMLDQQRLERNVEEIRRRITAARERSGRAAATVRLVAATKYVEADALPQLAAAGVRDIGENRLQSARAKRDALGGDGGLNWHFIGAIQSNKVNAVLELFSMIHTIDSLKHGKDVDKRVVDAEPRPVLFEVNVSGEPSKAGFSPDELRRVFPRLLELENLEPRGLMTMAPLVDDPELTRPCFAALRELRDELASRYGLDGFDELSMGMTQDYEVAVEEGATLVRIGSALYEGLL